MVDAFANFTPITIISVKYLIGFSLLFHENSIMHRCIISEGSEYCGLILLAPTSLYRKKLGWTRLVCMTGLTWCWSCMLLKRQKGLFWFFFLCTHDEVACDLHSSARHRSLPYSWWLYWSLPARQHWIQQTIKGAHLQPMGGVDELKM